MHSIVGHITEINRYPIKSFAGERLSECQIEPYGMLGDRHGTFYDTTKSGWSRYVTARNIPKMLTYQASFQDGEIQVTSANGQTFGWNEALLSEIQSLTTTPITMSRLKEAHPEHPHLLSVDGASILLVTDASLRKLEAACQKDLDQRRFRGNFVVKVNDESVQEGDWIGKQLSIGEVIFQVDSYCERCVMITVDPTTLEKDPAVLRHVNESFDLHFGVYASVIQPGRIQLGDAVIVK
ncbi:MOSC domain-containing protein [Paenibacillus roseipurpureus]|uniref:MOSC domain-containing protein n=1 Tax=Paenibacillus roseopurpureus TaxID=2918901 RepID=A0AA96LNI6_9BACL|nr:MOSC N-terminal beta barrel domain-containing protein [Paenibacillus sp. MBLB1832]WNR42070.1 MOSC domain-containing protein [Paenibacillus sp. MBLB1832]